MLGYKRNYKIVSIFRLFFVVTTKIGKNRLCGFLAMLAIYTNFNDGIVFLTDIGAVKC